MVQLLCLELSVHSVLVFRIGGLLRRVVIASGLLDAQIAERERTDCELFYLSYVNKHGPKDAKERSRQHPRWEELCTSTPIRSIAVLVDV